METLLSNGNGQNSTASGSATFNNLYPALIRVFAVIILGYITGRLGIISVTEAKGLSKFAMFPTLPAFIFRAIATIHFSKLKWMFVFVVTLSKCIVFAGVTLLTFLFTRDIGKAGIYSVFCTMSNDLALGMPICKYKPCYDNIDCKRISHELHCYAIRESLLQQLSLGLRNARAW